MKKRLLFIVIIFISCNEGSVVDKAINKSISISDFVRGKIFFSKKEKIKEGETFGQILEKLDIPLEKQSKIKKEFSKEVDMRMIRANSIYEPLYDKDSNLCYVVYHKNHIDKIVIGVKDSVFVKKEHKVLKLVPTKSSGIIEESLGATITKNNLPASLAIKVEDIYSWTVNFFALQKGDNFKVLYKKQYIDDTLLIGTDKVTASVFNHNGDTFYAFLYKLKNGKEEYFDEKGKSLKKKFLKAPLKSYRITSKYSRRRFHPVLHINRAHLGTDFAAPRGTPILSTADGVVSKKSYSKTNGYYIKVRHNSMYSTQYLHMSRFRKGVKLGTKVKQGQVIGYVGATGYATGPHVCYRFWKNGNQVNPFAQKNPETKPIPKDELESFAKFITPLKERLDEMEFSNQENLI